MVAVFQGPELSPTCVVLREGQGLLTLKESLLTPCWKQVVISQGASQGECLSICP